MVTRTGTLEVVGLKIAGQLYLPGEANQPPCPTVCICHGIPAWTPDPGNRGYPLLAERVCRQGFAVFIFDLRGTGASKGNLDISGWPGDLQAAVDYLYASPEIDQTRFSLLGFSGGAAVSAFVATHDNRISSVVACACPAEFTFTETKNSSPLIDHFRSIGAIRDKDFPHSAEGWISIFRVVSPIKYVAGITPRPLLLVHGSDDETVDVDHTYRLYTRAGKPTLIILEGAEHRLRQVDWAMNIVIDRLKSQQSN